MPPLTQTLKMQHLSLSLLGALSLIGCSDPPSNYSGIQAKKRGGASERPPAEIVVVSRKKMLADYPCQQCHQHVRAGEQAPLNAHAEIVVTHMQWGQNCETCHDPENPETLVLATGATFDLDEVQELCRQCHSNQVEDWEVGIHGKQLGNWLKEVQRYSCTACHNPHKPAFGSMESVPPPPFPRLGISKGKH